MTPLDSASSAVHGLPSRLPGFPSAAVDLAALLEGVLAQNTRLLELHFAADSGIADNQLLVHRISGFEGVNEGFRYEVECLSSDAFLALKDLEGVPAQVTILTAAGTRREINGVILGVGSEGSDGSLAVYRLLLEPVTAALRLGRTSRVFLGKTDLEVVLLLLREVIQSNSVFGACLNLDNRCRGHFPVREFIFQCGENTWDFIRRRLAKIGVSFVFAPAKDGSVDFPQHTLILFDSPLDLEENEAGRVRFHRVDGTEERDAITDWHARRSLQCGAVTRRTWDQGSGALSTTTEALQSDQGTFGNALASTIEDYRQEAPLEHDDLAAQEGFTPKRVQVREQRTKAFSGSGSIRDFRAGTTFTLTQHPVHDQDPAQSRVFVLTRVALEARNNLPKDLAEAFRPEAKDSAPVYRNHFDCVRTGVPILPEELPAPDPGLLTGTVVGPEGEAVHTGALGRLKIRLHGTREQEHPEAGASLTDKDSCWIRLLQPWSSQGMGGNFLPRVGDEVLLEALHHDPDKLVILGVLPSCLRKPGRFSEVSELPGDRAVSGLRSRAHRGLDGNQILFDDTPGEVRAQFASDHQASELNLGFLAHPRRQGRAAPKGGGAELRTDGAVAIRGGKGVFISADARPHAGGSQLSRDEALGHLGAALALTKTVGDLSAKHGMDPLETGPQGDLLKASEDWEKGTNTDPKHSGGQSPLLLASAPAGMALSSGADTTVQAASNLDLVALRHVQVSAGRRMLFHAMESIGLFAHRLGMKLIAASGDVSIQAQEGFVELIATKVLRLMSTKGRIELDAAEGILLRSGGAFIELKDGGIRHGGPGACLGEYASVSWSGPASRETQTRAFGKSRAEMDDFLRIYDKAGDPIPDRRYRITREDGTVLEGVTDQGGDTQVVQGETPETLEIQIFPVKPQAGKNGA